MERRTVAVNDSLFIVFRGLSWTDAQAVSYIVLIVIAAYRTTIPARSFTMTTDDSDERRRLVDQKPAQTDLDIRSEKRVGAETDAAQSSIWSKLRKKLEQLREDDDNMYPLY